MSGKEPFPNSSPPFPGSQTSSHTGRPLLSPISHYRELFATGGKRKRGRNRLPIPARPESVVSPQLDPAANEKSRLAYRADVATYTYNFAQDFAMTDDIIESDATDDCSDYEPPELGEDAEPCPSPQRQGSCTARRKSGGFEADNPPREEAQDWESVLGVERIHCQNTEQIQDTAFPSLSRDSSEGLFSICDWERNSTPETSAPPLESEERGPEPESVKEDRNRRRERSIQLGNTPSSVRNDDGGSPAILQCKELRFEEPDFEHEIFEDGYFENADQPVLTSASRDRIPRAIRNSQSAIEKVLVKNRQIGPPLQPAVSDAPAQSIVRIDCNSLSASTDEEDPELQYTISDAILDMHQLMGGPFWGDDRQWLVNITLPVQRSRPNTPYSDEIIKATTKLIETIDSIKAKEGNSKQARCAVEINYRVGCFMTQIREACTTICHHIFGNTKQGSPKQPQIHVETVHRMRKYVMPRLVAVISKAFTLLCNPMPEIRHLVICIIEQICFDTERAAKIIEFGTETSEDNLVAEVEEFMHSLAVVREWAKAERNMEGDSRSIVL